MATSVHSGEDSAAHTATDQWQSFELRMRRRRVERLLTRAAEACQTGREDAAREALAEIEQLSPFEPRLTELHAQVEALRPASSTAPASSALFADEQTDVEFTSSVESPSIAAESFVPSTPHAVEPSPRPVETIPIKVDATTNTAEPLIDLPLVIEEPRESTGATATRADEQEKRSGRGLALAAAALLACGAIGWFIGPKMTTLMQTERTVSAEPNQPPVLPSPGAAAATDEPRPAEALPPVQVAVDEVPAANSTVEPTPTKPETISPSSPPPASVELRPTEPLVREPAVAPSRTEAPPPPEPPPPAPLTSLPQAAASVERPAAPVPVLTGDTTPVTRPTSSPAIHEPMPPAAAPPPATPDAASAVARDEEKIREILDRYATAYSQLDAAAASAIFPGLDRRALTRAFDGLASQKVALGACDVRVAIESAIVDCAGSATWTPKIGGGSRTEPRRWQFRLRNTSGDWQMVAAKVR